MRYLALAVDYDGTAARNDRLSNDAQRAVERLRISGRRIVLVTGRRLDDLLRVCPAVALFDVVVAENGAVVYDPRRHEEIVLGAPVPRHLVDRLRERGVAPVEVGKVLVATRDPYGPMMFETIRELGLELHVIANRSAVMALPPGINKASGVEFALHRLGLSRHEAVAIGDAENDHSLLMQCECGVAVANAAPALKEVAAFVTRGANGSGVAELIDEIVADDLHRMEGKIERNLVHVGVRSGGTPVRIPPYGRNVLIAGPSGSGKTTVTTALVERLIDKTYQVCIVDPEGDYGALPRVVPIGNRRRAPSVNEILSILEDPAVNLSVNLLGVPLEDRPAFFSQLIPSLVALRARTGRPHWVVLDEAHHMLPQTWRHAESTLPPKFGETILVTVHPDYLTPPILSLIDVAFAVGHSPDQTLGAFARTTGRRLTWPQDLAYEPGKIVAWIVGEQGEPFSMKAQSPRAERLRHLRKYAEGNLGYHSFYFRGPDCRHNLRAQNLAIFSQIAEGIDEETWMFHLRSHHYSQWFRQSIKDSRLADEMERIEQRTDITPQQTRDLVRALIGARYTLPA
ncbi:MAG TPA: HAD family hydrolase [Gammaproteobacteria bacterium]|nr:HAD family hydrolase [Gammaproteobacteria bacterium]